jgi:hypothetical protein
MKKYPSQKQQNTPRMRIIEYNGINQKSSLKEIKVSLGK